MISPGRVPIRAAGDGSLPVPGAEGRFDWTGFIPYEALPRSVDPQRGYLLNANNRLVGPDYPYLLSSDWEPPYRARRIDEVLAASPALDQAGEPAAPARPDLDLRQGAAALPYGRHARGRARAHDPGRDAGLGRCHGRDAARAARLRRLVSRTRTAARRRCAGAAGLRGSARRARTRWRGCCASGRPGATTSRPRRSRPAPSARPWPSLARSLAGRAFGSDWRQWRWDGPHVTVMEHRPFSRVPWLERLFHGPRPDRRLGHDGERRGL